MTPKLYPSNIPFVFIEIYLFYSIMKTQKGMKHVLVIPYLRMNLTRAVVTSNKQLQSSHRNSWTTGLSRVAYLNLYWPIMYHSLSLNYSRYCADFFAPNILLRPHTTGIPTETRNYQHNSRFYTTTLGFVRSDGNDFMHPLTWVTTYKSIGQQTHCLSVSY